MSNESAILAAGVTAAIVGGVARALDGRPIARPVLAASVVTVLLAGAAMLDKGRVSAPLAYLLVTAVLLSDGAAVVRRFSDMLANVEA